MRRRVIDRIKVDIEGHEVEFMKGAAKTLATFRPIIQLQFIAAITNRAVSKSMRLLKTWFLLFIDSPV